MSKLSNELLMLRLLENGRKYSINELSSILEVTPRMIRTYKNDLEMSGIIIDSIKGKYGGYIVNNAIFKNNFSKYDLELLNGIKEILINNNYPFLGEYNILLEKIDNNLHSTKIKDGSFVSVDDQNIYNIISKGIQDSLKVKIDYLSLDGNVLTRIIHPCHIFNYNDEMYVAAFCELRNEIRHFEFKRIKNIKLLDINFI